MVMIDLKTNRFCPICKTLVDRSHWARHSKTHNPSVKKSCALCKAAFGRKDNFIRHVKTKHADENLHCCGSSMDTANYVKHQWEVDHEAGNDAVKSSANMVTNPTDGDMEPLASTSLTPQENIVPEETSLGPNLVPLISNPQPYEWWSEPKVETPNDIWNDVCNYFPQASIPLLRKNWEYIRSYVNERDPIVNQYNYRLIGSNQMDAKKYFKWLYERKVEEGARIFKVKAALHVLLKHKTDDSFKFFYGSNNNYNLPLTMDQRESTFTFIKSMDDVKRVVDEGLTHFNFNEYADLIPEDTKWKVERVIGIHFWVLNVEDMIIGAPSELPQHLRNNYNLSTYRYDVQRNYYKDNLCAFRFIEDCLHDCKGNPKQTDVVDRFQEYMRRYGKCTNPKIFEGISMEDFDRLEDFFHVGIQLYSLQEDGKVRFLRAGMYDYDDDSRPMFYGNLHKTDDGKYHISRILNLAKFQKAFFCDFCQQQFSRSNNMEQHIRKKWCSRGQTKFTFPGGTYEDEKSIYTELEEIGISLDDPQNERYYPFRVVYDFESILKRTQDAVQLPEPTTEQEMNTRRNIQELNFDVQTNENANIQKLQIMNEHVPITFSIVSNIPGEETPYIQTAENPKQLIDSFVDRLEEMSATAMGILDEKYESQISQLEEMIQRAKGDCKARDEKWEEEEHGTKRRGTPDKIWLKKLLYLKGKFKSWRSRLPILGYNSGSYDLPLIREYLYPKLVANARNEARKKKAQKTFDERMLKFLKLKVKSRQDEDLDWGEDILDDEEDEEEEEEEVEQDPMDIPENEPLDFSDIPTLIKQGTGIMCLTTKTLKFLDLCRYLAPGTSLDMFLKSWEKSDSILAAKGQPIPFGKIKSTKIPFPYTFLDSIEKLDYVGVPSKDDFKNNLRREQISDKDYEFVTKLYEEKGFKSFKEYLHYYVMLDTVPMLQAINKLFHMMYGINGIDMFKEAMSLPGLTLKFLSRKTPNFNFSLFGQNDEEVYNDLRSGMTGGLAVVNNRLAEVGKTCIRGDPNFKVKEILGLDFNAQYLAALGREMPTGYYDHWMLVENGRFGPYLKKKGTNKNEAYIWLEYVRKTLGTQIIHAKRNGYEKRCGPRQIPVDGIDEENKIIYEYNGCFWHMHEPCECSKNIHTTNPRTKRTVAQCAAELQDRTEYLESLGYTVVIKWECQWLEQKKDSKVQEVLQSLSSKIFQTNWSVSHNKMVQAIADDKMFGFVKCNISCPDNLKEFFNDFPPIIKHAEIGIDDIGEYMKSWCEKNGEMKRTRKSLIGSYHGKEVWLLTPVLKYLMEKGLNVTKIYDVLQYEREACFTWFRDIVTEKRKEGDKAPETAMMASMFKLHGNAAYGKTATALQRHKQVGLIGKEYVRAAVKDPFLENIEPLGDSYEVTLRPRKKKMALPVQIALAVYQYSKMYMMEFAWDVLGKYANPQLYDWMESDTDSIYLMLGCETFDDIIFHDKREEYESIKSKYFVIDEEKDKRTPGLLKVEYKGGQEMVCLRAKMYAIRGKEENKLSSSGLMKRTNDLSVDDYRKVIETEEIGTGVNVGFMKRNNKINTYVQERAGLSNLYIKRKVLNDGVSTVPLDI